MMYAFVAANSRFVFATSELICRSSSATSAHLALIFLSVCACCICDATLNSKYSPISVPAKNLRKCHLDHVLLEVFAMILRHLSRFGPRRCKTSLPWQKKTRNPEVRQCQLQFHTFRAVFLARRPCRLPLRESHDLPCPLGQGFSLIAHLFFTQKNSQTCTDSEFQMVERHVIISIASEEGPKVT